jgi:hypothetical protein
MRYGKLLWNDLMVKRPISDTNGPSDAEDMFASETCNFQYRVGLSDWLAGLVHAFEAARIRTVKVDVRLLLAHAFGPN